MIASTDPLGNLTRYELDGLNRITKQTDAIGGITTYSFDANSNLLSHTNAKGGVTLHSTLATKIQRQVVVEHSAFWDANFARIRPLKKLMADCLSEAADD